MRELVYKFNPAVPSRWLLLLAGLLWTSVGAILCYRAFGWIESLNESSGNAFLASGAALAIVGNRFMLSNVAQRNVGRIAQLPQRACVFAFTAWRGYGMIALMIALGFLLRNSPVPKDVLAAAYVAMGGALVLSSFIFYRSFWKS